MDKDLKSVYAQLLDDDGTQALVILTILLRLFGDAVFGSDDTPQLDPAELWADVNEAVGVWMPEENENKTLALITALESDAFYSDPVVFSSVVNALYDGDLGDMINGVFEVPTLTEVMWGVTEVDLARNDDDGPPVFSSRIRALIDEIANVESVDMEEAENAIAEEINDMFSRLKMIGVTDAQLRLLREEHEETTEAMDYGDGEINDADVL